MDTDIFCSASFSGYRPEKFYFPLEFDNLEYERLQTSIHNAIIQALELGYKTFLCGMAKGFDLTCADILLDIREQQQQYSNTRLIAILPYAAHTFKDSWGNLHKIVKQCADQIVIVSPEYTQSCYYQRNRYLVENASHLICYWDGQSGGTAQTVGMAQERGLTICNLSDTTAPKRNLIIY
ncbi:SLOG family protein [Anaerotruncus massiliensis (ex Togo et al. 2019)]|uniref:SLOG family protein n=1 Tax=Anaerotruncus massiliensis (ex Togo et al. 2019) TaxID=1673720 RepID=UPI0027B8BEC0|nr:SLOG family protein [Anaerotruncus massiliensis (ex Togo et al. 2019)]